MSNDHNTGGQAFPQFGPQIVGLDSDGAPKLEYEFSEGMTLRDYFAAKAMQGELAAQSEDSGFYETFERLAGRSYAIADAMMKAREA